MAIDIPIRYHNYRFFLGNVSGDKLFKYKLLLIGNFFDKIINNS